MAPAPSQDRKPPRPRPIRRLLPVLLLGLLTLLLAGAAARHQDPRPAGDWNLQAQRRIEAAAALNPLTFAVFGDTRDSRGLFEHLLRQVAADPALSFAIHLGDMVHQGGEAEFRVFFRQVRQHFPRPLLGVIGNHELADRSPLLWESFFGPRYSAFQVQGHRFLMLDNSLGAVDEAQLGWLARELEQARASRSRLVFLHLPLFDPRGGSNRHALPPDVGQRLAALFQRHRVTHVFTGHIHGYFTGEWQGVPYTITGGGGVKLAGADPVHHFHHYLKVNLTDGRVTVQVQRLAAAPTGR